VAWPSHTQVETARDAHGVTRGVRLLQALVAVLSGGYLLSTLPFPRGGAHDVPVLDIGPPTAALVASIALVLVRAVRVPGERGFCLALAASPRRPCSPTRTAV
jgi:hypothetical protein